MNIRRIPVAVTLVVLTLTVTVAASRGDRWSAEEAEAIRSLSLAELEPLSPDPTNRVSDDSQAIDLGHRLFFDKRFSSNGQVSCATCHVAQHEFQDDRALAVGVGTTTRRTMPVAATAFSPFLFWDGRKDSQWAQALGPLESAVEHGGTRAQYAHLMALHYRREYEELFGGFPDLSGVPDRAAPVDDPVARSGWEQLSDEQRLAVTDVFVNVGKAIAAYERQIQYGPSRFDRYAQELSSKGGAPSDILTGDEVAGLRLFIGKANCIQCHNGPLLTNNEFHNTGVPRGPGAETDRGRATGATGVLADEFNCRSRWSDGDPSACSELEFMVAEGAQLERAFKVPSLRNVADRPPYMHAGQFETLDRVVAHYNDAPAAPGGRSELKPLRLTPREQKQLVAFLRALSGGTSAPADLMMDPFAEAAHGR